MGFFLPFLSVIASAAENPVILTDRQIYKINAVYKINVRPIIKQKCFDCHSDQTRYPWYYVIPGIKHLIDQDIREGRDHIDFSEDFPFEGHGNPLEDFEAIEEVMREDAMPLLKYRLMHWGSGLTDLDKESIRNWIKFAKGIIEK